MTAHVAMPDAGVNAQGRERVRQAVILAAGLGSRLRPRTHHIPKPLVDVLGTPILINALRHLQAVGVERVVLVTGHLGAELRATIGDRFEDMEIVYVHSDVYGSTNNIYSLWLAREYLDRTILLIEGDVFFRQSVLDRLLAYPGENVAALSPNDEAMQGTVAEVDPSGRIVRMIDESQQVGGEATAEHFKTINMYLLQGDFLTGYFLPHLEAHIKSGGVQRYYESILIDMLPWNCHALRAAICPLDEWHEVDDEQDRTAAEYKFASPEERYRIVSGQYGGYWRYGLVDHAYLYNLYFPPPSLLQRIGNQVAQLVQQYPVGQDELNRCMSNLTELPPERLLTANGASELIRAIMRLPGMRAILPVPSFNEYAGSAPPGSVVELPMDGPDFDLDVDAFARRAEEERATMAIVVNPNNPTSRLVPRAELLRLAARLAAIRCRLLVDESFIDFAGDAAELSLVPYVADHPNVVIIKSLSKVYGICGVRLGYLFTVDEELRGAVAAAMPIWNVNGFAEEVLRLLPRYRTAFLKSCRRVAGDTRQLFESLRGVPGLEPIEPSANYILCRLPAPAPSADEVTCRMFLRYDTLIKSCSGKSMPDADRYLRIATRTPEENQRLARNLEELLHGGNESRSPAN
ncbi:MAG: aminotransferase class I/II-fold pyridoxal phosphate-dependent enzyme [Thermoanaerobaculia bacterium]